MNQDGHYTKKLSDKIGAKARMAMFFDILKDKKMASKEATFRGCRQHVSTYHVELCQFFKIGVW